jgi:DnaJ-class molecular chaperone
MIKLTYDCRPSIGQQKNNMKNETQSYLCRPCKGSGKISKDICPACHGTGYTQSESAPAQAEALTTGYSVKMIKDGNCYQIQKVGCHYVILILGDDGTLADWLVRRYATLRAARKAVEIL